MKTASRILGAAFFRAGYEVQDAPRYGAERRGAPMLAYVRAARQPINERGEMPHPDLVVVADDTLIGVPAAGVLQGLDDDTVLLIESAEPAQTWRQRLAVNSTILRLPEPAAPGRGELHFVGAACAGAAARLVGEIERHALAEAVTDELSPLGADVVEENRRIALSAYDRMAPEHGAVGERHDAATNADTGVNWVDLPFEIADKSAPVIHAALTSVHVRTGLWRTMRPVIDYDRCRKCWWVCSTFCPDNAIRVTEEGRPEIDYDHCKGCMICVAQCPPHAIGAIPEAEAVDQPEAVAP